MVRPRNSSPLLIAHRVPKTITCEVMPVGGCARAPPNRLLGVHIRPVVSRLVDHAGAFRPARGRCFRLVTDQDGKPSGCPNPVIASGYHLADGRRYQVDACGEHSGQLRRRGPLHR